MSSLLIISSCKINDVANREEKINVALLDSKFCETDEDCVITSSKAKDCCNKVCSYDSINKNGELERAKWEKQNCGPKDYQKCEYAECIEVPNDYIALCINNKCEMKKKIGN